MESKENPTQKFRKTKKGVLTNSYSKQKKRYSVDYTLKQLHARFLNDSRFDRLFNEWVKSGYNKQFKPTVDRIYYKKPYTLRNIHCMTWADNRYKQRMEMKDVKARKVCMVVNGRIAKTFESQRKAISETGISQSNISRALNSKYSTAGGCRWEYKDSIHEHAHLLEGGEV